MTVMGISVIDPGSDRIETAIMTLEGLVIFDAVAIGGSTHVHRAVPPFDSPHFADGLMRDVRFMYMTPGSLQTTGRRDDGSAVCRYQDNSSMTVDVTPLPGQGWEIEQYSTRGKKLRALKLGPLENGYPARIDLEALSPKKYTLHLNLISAEPLAPADATRVIK